MLHTLLNPLREWLIQKMMVMAFPLLAQMMHPAEIGMRLGLAVAILTDLMFVGRQISKFFPKRPAK